jgi:undecaprenyl-diphosphatase
MSLSLLVRLHARDSALMIRWVIGPDAPRRSRRAWTALTHLGGTGPSIAAAAAPWFQCCSLHAASRVSLLTLIVSHLLVQIVKRTVVRTRPGRTGIAAALVREPDRFSFPSGHAAAAMSVALGYGVAFPAFAAPMLVLALLIGFSRVRLGVHFPGDVLAGQSLALGTGALVLLLA